LRLASHTEFRISLLAFAGVLLLGLLDGLLLAAVGALVMLIANAARPAVVVLGREPGSGIFVDRARYPDAGAIPGALVIRSAGAWLYINADYIRRRVLELIDGAPADLKIVVLDLSIVPAVDTTAGAALRALAKALKRRGIALALAQLRDDALDNLRAAGAEEDLGPIAAHRTIEDCLSRAP
jgi:MFS superfamily sulfate permease-like transporter